MTQKQPYTYTTLRYIHDVRAGEFLNVGIVLYAPLSKRVIFQTRKTFKRIKSVFPDLNGEVFRASMLALDNSLKLMSWDGKLMSGDNAAPGDALSFARRALPHDDSSLQWSPISSGLTDDPEKTLIRLYDRLVTQYDKGSPSRLSDEDVWKPFRDKLSQRGIPLHLEEKTVVGATDEISFSHAWRNGHWHAYEPISLDLADAEGIKDKARRWRGHLAAVADGKSETLSLNFIVGAPQGPTLQAAYTNALEILRKSEFHPKIFETSQLDELINEIEDEFRSHMGRIDKVGSQ